MSNVNIKDIARAAGVCEATVSRTLRTPDIVSPKTRDKVMAAVNKMNYTPNRLGASLRQGSSRNVLVMLPDITNPFFSPIVRGIERSAMAQNYSVLLGDTLDDPKIERSFANMVWGRQADGIIINSQRIPFDLQAERDGQPQHLPPIVSTSEVVLDTRVHRVIVNNVAVGEDATQHLLDLGHTRIAAIAGPVELRTTIDRLSGYKQSLSAANLEADHSLIKYGDYSAESGIAAVDELMLQKSRPTAIFCLGDLVAIGTLHRLRELGFQVPKDISVVGVDGIKMTEYLAPPLTTVAQPLEDIGRICMETLIQLIEGEKPQELVTTLPHRLIIRKSTAPAPKP